MSDPNPFASFHRRRWLAQLGTRAAVLAAATILIAGVVSLAAAAPESSAGSVQPPVLAAPVNATAAQSLPEPAPTSSNVPAAPPAPPTLPRTGNWAIDIDTAGYQVEIDACLWVRMDLGAVAPIVGAHNYCGGDIVLDMLVGDTVTLRGTSLDGVYVVSDSVDGRAGDNAGDATAGLSADVILQTCYWESSGRSRLVALIRTT